jgi:hypothetical protein
VAMSAPANCVSQEYGDPFDVMGTNHRQMNAFFKAQLGYLEPANIHEWTGDGVFTLTPLQAASTGFQLIRIPRIQDGANEQVAFYYIDYRRPLAPFDTFAAGDAVVNGVSIRVGPDYSRAHQSKLVDTTPGSPGGFQDAALGCWTFGGPTRPPHPSSPACRSRTSRPPPPGSSG